MRWRGMLHNRFVMVPAMLAILIVGWNIYFTQHDHGRLAGRVVNTDGHPIADATVVLYEQQFIDQVERARTLTDASGWFHFNGNASHLIELQAIAPGGTTSPRQIVRLWFRAQDRVLKNPLVVSARR